MIDAGFKVELTPEAERDFLNQMVWFDTNRGSHYADRFDQAFDQLQAALSQNPKQCQKVIVCGRYAHRAILFSTYVVLYQVVEHTKQVLILAIRGAAEDWTNQPLPQ